jgi:hypothetical protein
MAKKKAATTRKPAPRPRPSRGLPTTRKIGRYDNVVFEFMNDNTSLEQRGTVIVRAGEMVIEIPEQDGYAASLVIGKSQGHYFRGANSIRGADALKIDARWADLGDLFAGTWQDEDDDLLFRFRLPRAITKVVK